MFRLITAVLAGVAAAGIAASAQGTLNYSFEVECVSGTLPGGRVPVAIYLKETATGGDTSLLASEQGLFSAGFKLQWLGSVAGDPAEIAGSADILPNPAFDDTFGPPVVTWAPSQTTVLEMRDFFAAAGVLPVDLGGGVARVFLGTVVITASSWAGDVSQFRVSDLDAGTDDTVTWNTAIGLDGAYPIADALFAIATAPEPVTTSLALLGLAAVGLGVGRRRTE